MLPVAGRVVPSPLAIHCWSRSTEGVAHSVKGGRVAPGGSFGAGAAWAAAASGVSTGGGVPASAPLPPGAGVAGSVVGGVGDESTAAEPRQPGPKQALQATTARLDIHRITRSISNRRACRRGKPCAHVRGSGWGPARRDVNQQWTRAAKLA